jgi:hypothetical protein
MGPSDPRVGHCQDLQSLQLGHLWKNRIRDLRVDQVQFLDNTQVAQQGESFVGDRAGTQVQIGQVVQAGKVFQRRIVDLGLLGIRRNHQSLGVLDQRDVQRLER